MKTKIAQHLRKGIGSTGRKLLVVLFAAGLSLGASAQRGVHGGGGGVYHGGGHYGGVVYTRPYVGVGFGLGWGLGFGYGPYSFWGPWGWGAYPYPPYYYGYGATPPPLADQINGIKDDYSAQIKDVRHDKALTHHEKKDKINQLKKDRDAAVIQARKDFYYNSRRNYNGPQPYNGNGQPQQQQQNQNQQKPTSGAPSNGEQPEYETGQSAGGGTVQGK